MKNSQTLQQITDSVNSAITAASDVISEMAEKERISIDTLATRVAAKSGIDAASALKFATFVAHNLEGVYVSRGKFGGVVKGIRQIGKMPKPSSATSDDTSSDDGSSDDSVEG